MLHTSKHHLQNNISQQQVKIKRRSKKHFSPLNMAFPHEFTQITGWGVFSPTLGAQITKKKFLKIFEIY